MLELVHPAPAWKGLPHVVKFSGGRSSAAMLLGLLYSRQLSRRRGDVVVFNNTSAESRATYAFVRRLQEITERRFNIPFFWIEFATYEDASRGDWRRIPGYRLVKPRPRHARMPKGYHWRGEVFEEMVSWKQRLPSRFTRICTEYLKLYPTALFLTDWFGRSGAEDDGPRRLGHWHGGSRIDPARYGGRAGIVQYHITRPVERGHQPFQEYTAARLAKKPNPVHREMVFDRKASLRGEYAAPFVSIIGLRADEPARVGRVMERNRAFSTSERFADGESVIAPLFDAGMTREDVMTFWERQSFDLQSPAGLNDSNCVFCFMKGTRELQRIAAQKKDPAAGADPTPEDAAWWRDLERRYARRVPSSTVPGGWSTFGFFGKDHMFFDELVSGEASGKPARGEAVPCECTD